jgi:hypothetical protein
MAEHSIPVAFDWTATCRGEAPDMPAIVVDAQVASELLSALKALTDWGREHTSPLDRDSPHALLITARAAIAKAEGK